jgi:hypothetical protein
MRKLLRQISVSTLIAVLTTITTTAFTNYLLARPWCIRLDPDRAHRIMYGSDKCSPSIADAPQRLIAQEKDFDQDAYSKYQ